MIWDHTKWMWHGMDTSLPPPELRALVGDYGILQVRVNWTLKPFCETEAAGKFTPQYCESLISISINPASIWSSWRHNAFIQLAGIPVHQKTLAVWVDLQGNYYFSLSSYTNPEYLLILGIGTHITSQRCWTFLCPIAHFFPCRTHVLLPNCRTNVLESMFDSSFPSRCSHNLCLYMIRYVICLCLYWLYWEGTFCLYRACLPGFTYEINITS